jgi:hypothetical protein
VVIRARSRWPILVVSVAVGGGYVLHDGLGTGGYVLLALLLLAIVAAFRMRVAADASGVTVVNLALPVRTPWREIDGFGMRSSSWRYSYSNSLVVRLGDGRGVRGWALTTDGIAAYSQQDVDAALSELRQRLADANGETIEAADARAMQAALVAAAEGNYAPFWELAGDFRVPPRELWKRVDELAAEGRIDEDALRRSGPQLSRSARRYLAKRHPEILEDAERP